MKLKKLAILLVIAGCCFPPSAIAGGSLGLDEIMPLIGQSKKLNNEVKDILQQTGKNPTEVTCVGIRLGRHFESLSAYRVAPFECLFATNKLLKIEAENFVKLPDGRTITIEEFSELPRKPEQVSLMFRLKSWKWE